MALYGVCDTLESAFPLRLEQSVAHVWERRGWSFIFIKVGLALGKVGFTEVHECVFFLGFDSSHGNNECFGMLVHFFLVVVMGGANGDIGPAVNTCSDVEDEICVLDAFIR